MVEMLLSEGSFDISDDEEVDSDVGIADDSGGPVELKEL
jgi:hypothetical protein